VSGSPFKHYASNKRGIFRVSNGSVTEECQRVAFDGNVSRPRESIGGREVYEEDRRVMRVTQVGLSRRKGDKAPTRNDERISDGGQRLLTKLTLALTICAMPTRTNRFGEWLFENGGFFLGGS